MTHASRESIQQNSPLRWAGSKRSLIPTLTKLVPRNFKRYIEPFAGGASLFFQLQPPTGIIADFNLELIQFYHELRDEPCAVHRAVSSLWNGARDYYQIRALDPAALSSTDSAARFLYLNRRCFNGLYRTNREGRFNVPEGRNTGLPPSRESLKGAAKILRKVDILCSDYRDTLRDLREGDFVYLDPPYSDNEKKQHGEYGYGAFGSEDFSYFLEALHSLDQRGVKFIVSYRRANKLLLGRPGHWRAKAPTVRRNIAGFAGARECRSELIVYNYDPSD